MASVMPEAVRELQRQVYLDFPLATWNRVETVDCALSYEQLRARVADRTVGLLSGGMALAAWRAATERNFYAWCYDFGFADCLTHAVAIVEVDRSLWICDGFLNTVCDCPFDEFVEALRRGILPPLHAGSTGCKTYLADPPVECDAIMGWLRANAIREEAIPGGLTEFEIPWDLAALEATHPGIGAAYDRLEAAGLPRNAYFLMLYPLRVFDGQRWDSNVNSMPLLPKGIREFSSPSARRRDTAPDEPMKSGTASQLYGQLSDMREALCRLEAGMANRNGGTVADTADQQTPPPWVAGLEGLGAKLSAAAEQQRKLAGEIEAAKTGLAAVGQTMVTRLDDVSATLITQLNGVAQRVDETSTALGSQDHALGQRLNEVATALAAQDQALGRRLDETASALLAQLQALSGRLDEEIARAATAPEPAILRRIEQAHAILAAEVPALAQRLEGTSAAAAASRAALAEEVRALSRRLDAAIAASAGSGEALDRQIAEARTGLTGRIEALERHVADTGATLAEQIAVAQRAAGTNSALAQRLEEANTVFAARLQAVSQHVTAASAMWSATEQALDQRIADAGRSLEATTEALAERSEALAERTEALAERTEALAERTGALAERTDALAEQAGEARTASASLQSDAGAMRMRLDEAVVAWEGGHQALELSLFSLRRELKDKGAQGEAVAGRLDGLGARLDEVTAVWHEQQAALERSLNALVAELADDRGGAVAVASRLTAVETRSADAEGWRSRIEADLAGQRRAAEEAGEELRALQRNLEAAATWLLGELQQYQKKSRRGFLSRWFAAGGKP